MSATTLISPPAIEPVTVPDAKSHLRVTASDEDTLIGNLIKAAREDAESFTRRALITQTWELVLDAFPSDSMVELPLPPLQSIESLTYTDKDGNTTTWGSSNYFAFTDSEPGKLVLEYGKSWPTVTLKPAGGVRVRYVAGYGDATSDVPEAIRQAILMLVGHYYENREATTQVAVKELPLSVTWLLQPYQIPEF